MNTYEKLQAHLTKHMYSKGAHRGDAPLDGSRRGRTTERVIQQSNLMAVLMHNTKILRAYPDGSFMMDTGGWHGSPTTRAAMYDALKFTPLTGHHIYSRKIMGKSQLCMSLLDGRVVRYYDGMKFDAAGTLTTPLVLFERYRINPEESKEFAQGIKDSGFKAMFPLLYATCKAPESGRAFLPHERHLTGILTTDYRASEWPEIIEYFKFAMSYDHRAGRQVCFEAGDAKSCWAAIMKACKARMYETVASDVSADVSAV